MTGETSSPGMDLQEQIDAGLVKQTEDPTPDEITDPNDPNYIEPGENYSDEDDVDSLGGKRLR